MIQKFANNSAGHFGMMAAILSIPVVGSLAFGVDYLRAAQLRSELQNAADAAALSIARLDASDIEKVKKHAKDVFRANLKSNDKSAEILVNTFDKGGIEVAAHATVDSIFGIVLGIKEVPISVNTNVSLGTDTSYEVAMVLDNTYSMEGQKLVDLKEAALGLISSIQLNPNADVKIGLVPFSRYVNVGLSRRNASWLDVPADSSTKSQVCSNKRELISKTNCRWVWKNYYRDGRKLSRKYQKCNYKYGESKRVCSTRTNNLKWYGCVGSRDYPWNTRDGQYQRKIPGLLNVKCGQEISPLTNDFDAIKDSIKAMVANDETYLPTSFIWGQRMLSDIQPLAEGKKSSKNVKKIMIVMTDGETTASPKYPAHTGTDIKLSEKLMLETCNRTKNETDIRIITVKVDETPGLGGKNPPGGKIRKSDKSKKSRKSKKVKLDPFSQCATSVRDAYFIDDTSGLNDVFSEIGRQIAGIHLSR